MIYTGFRSQNNDDEDVVVDVEGRSDQEDDGAKPVVVKGSQSVKGGIKSEKRKDKPSTATGPPAEVSRPPLETPEQILSRLPPLDIDAIDWEDDSVIPFPLKREVTDEDVDRVLNEHVEGLNGNYTFFNFKFHSCTQISQTEQCGTPLELSENLSISVA